MGDAVKDWRLDNLETTSLDLRGANLVCKPYRLYAPHWDHDHCCGCWNRLAEPGDYDHDPDVLHEGYTVTDEHPKGADYYWVCVPCFKLFARDMNWRDVTPQTVH